MKLTQSMTEYLVLLGDLMRARHDGAEEDKILDKLDTAYEALDAREILAVKQISNALGSVRLLRN